MQTLTSARNPLLKDIRRAVHQGALTEDGCAVAEGLHLLDEARRGPCRIVAIVASESAALAVSPDYVVPDVLFASLASTETTQGVLTLVRPCSWTAEDVFRDPAMVLVLDRIQDPGNAGAMLRAAEAFGATGALFLKGSVNPFNPKCMRASAGSVFRVPFLAGGTIDPDLDQRGIELYALAPHKGVAVACANLRQGCALIVGSEGQGIRLELMERARPLHIPSTGVESLNAALAAGIALYEARRQRDEPV
jgi:TrmH family RNA methyltransferase